MELKVPFYASKEYEENPQVVMKTVLKYFLNKEFTISQLNKHTRREGFFVWTAQIASVLHELGLKIKFYSNLDLKSLLGGESSF
ncbi:MAG: hypothetical protein HYT70_02175 [Candidatus Aenigmarchaeota archaeon]|nr:hypothetical protein [Candidatus Aenigmarchaeota archaeon]